MRPTIILSAALALAACSQAPGDDTGEQTVPADISAEDSAVSGAEVPTPEPVATGTPESDTTATLEPTPTAPPTPTQAPTVSPGRLPPADAPARYVGRWAATERLCDTGAWRFERRRLVTAGEVSCDFDRIDKVPGGYDIAATCLAADDTNEDTIELRFAESAQAMLVQSEIWDGVGLIYCGAAD